MAELLQAVFKTVYPDGKIKLYEHGMVLTYRSTEGINVWYKWLHTYIRTEKKRRVKV